MEVPESVEIAWGLRERPGKGPKRTLSLEHIVEAALRVGSAEGLPAVSMSKIAAELGVSTMALYRYVTSKGDLLMLITDAVLGPPPPLPEPGDDWRRGVHRWAAAMRASLQRHPWSLRIPITGPGIMPNHVAWLEAGLRCLRGTGLDPDTKLAALLLVNGFVRTEVALLADLQDAFDASRVTDEEALSGYARSLARLTDAERFPEIHELLEARVFDMSGGPDDEFAFGMDRILDGVAVLVTGEPPA
ncbi:TetR/AcrR family transcriptional regulator [Streptosporangium sp. NPDC023825]|uniref:TetR/AcrR family transcriptional regulator n=1 Tax=Streptosporangium sp. NPDC023825 TaxID=3154909 RepID=UPI0034318C90